MKKIAVFGAGAMGRGIAQIAALAGLEVIVFDRFAANPRIQKSAENDVWSGLFLTKSEDGKLVLKSRAEVNLVFENIRWLDNSEENLAELKDCDAVVEAIFENIEVKKELYRKIEANLNPNNPALIFTNTSTIQISRLAEGLRWPERFMGTHFFNPVPLMKPIELIPHNTTANEVVLAAREFSKILGKLPLVAPDLPGFIVNRIAIPMITAFAKELERGASFKEIDKAFTEGTWPDNPAALRIVQAMIQRAETLVKEDQKNCRVQLTPNKVDELMQVGINMPVGPLALKDALTNGKAGGVKFVMGPAQFCDLVGLDVAIDCCKMLKMQEPDQWEVPEILKARIKEGKLGRKTGEGFYSHEGKVTVDASNAPNYLKVSYQGDVLSGSLVKNLKKAFTELKERLAKETFKTVILEVKAKGANIKEFPLGFKDPASVQEIILAWRDLGKAIQELPVPVIAVIKGYAFGGGYELALACDYIVTEQGTMVGLPEIGLGILPGGGGTQNLTRRVGWIKALEIILTAKKVKAEFPWVDAVMANADQNYLYLAGSEKLARKRKRDPLTMTFGDVLRCHAMLMFLRIMWKNKTPASFRLAQDAILEGNQLDLPSNGLLLEEINFKDAIQTQDAEEGIRAFLEKRKPNFQGK